MDLVRGYPDREKKKECEKEDMDPNDGCTLIVKKEAKMDPNKG